MADGYQKTGIGTSYETVGPIYSKADDASGRFLVTFQNDGSETMDIKVEGRMTGEDPPGPAIRRRRVPLLGARNPLNVDVFTNVGQEGTLINHSGPPMKASGKSPAAVPTTASGSSIVPFLPDLTKEDRA